MTRVITMKLRQGKDDIIAHWWDSLPERERSGCLRDLIKACLQDSSKYPIKPKEQSNWYTGPKEILPPEIPKREVPTKVTIIQPKSIEPPPVEITDEEIENKLDKLGF